VQEPSILLYLIHGPNSIKTFMAPAKLNLKQHCNVTNSNHVSFSSCTLVWNWPKFQTNFWTLQFSIYSILTQLSISCFIFSKWWLGYTSANV